MKDWIEKLHGFLQLNDRDILQGAGKISHELAETLALAQYERFEKKRRRSELDDSEFDRQMKRIESLGTKGKIATRVPRKKQV